MRDPSPTVKARSRLQSSTDQKSNKKRRVTGGGKSTHTAPQSKRLTKTQNQLGILSRYRQFAAAGLLSLPFFTAAVYILTQIQPAEIENWLIPHSFLPLLLASFGAGFFLFSYLLLNTRRGFLLAALTTTCLYLRLQQIIITPDVLGYILVLFGILELIAVVVSKSTKK